MPEAQAGPIPVLILFGPTAAGKTDLLERLFGGPQAFFPAEIVSADSMQVYRGMDIGTAKPPRALFDRLPHHLIDIRDPHEPFSVGDFVRLADTACTAIAARGRLPVISGGTGFYLKNFVQGLPGVPPSDPALRLRLQSELATRGVTALHDELAACDPASAEKIHRNDTYRLLRALEVFRLTGRPRSSFPANPEPLAGTRPAYRFLMVGLERARADLYRRIDQRCAAMFAAGLPDELGALVAAGYGPADPGLRAIGYQEFFLQPEGPPATAADLPAVQRLVARNSRRYAKRQLTFFASLPGVHWIPAADPSAAATALQALLAAFLAPGFPRPT